MLYIENKPSPKEKKMISLENTTNNFQTELVEKSTHKTKQSKSLLKRLFQDNISISTMKSHQQQVLSQ